MTGQSDSADISSLLIVHVPALRRYARALLHNTTDADDLVQDCLVRALSKADMFEPGTHLKAWLLSILHNIFLDKARKATRTRKFEQAMQVQDSGKFTRPNQLRNLELIEMQKALAALPRAQRSTVILIGLEGLTYEQAAKITKVPTGTVRSRLSRARRALMVALEGTSLDRLENTKIADAEQNPMIAA